MRWYRLSIGKYGDIINYDYTEQKDGSLKLKANKTGRQGGSILTFESNKFFPRHENITPLNIEFEVNSYSNLGNLSTICGIRLHSQSVTLYKELQNKVNKEKYVDITLEAGFDYSSPLVEQKLGYRGQSAGCVIYKGQVAGISGQFNAKNSVINITAAYIKPHSADNVYRVQIKKGELLFGTAKNSEPTYDTSTKEYKCQTMIQALTALLKEDVKPQIQKDLESIKWEGKDDLIWIGSNIKQFAEFLENRFGIAIYNDANNQKVIIYKLSTAQGENGYDTNAKQSQENAETINKILAQIDGVNVKNKLTPKQLSATELLTQPVFQGFSTMLEVTTALRPDITLGSIIQLPNANNGGIVLAMGGSFGMDNQYIAGLANEFDLTQQGKWYVTQCQHRGNFYGKSADSWSSHFVCLPMPKEQWQIEQEKNLQRIREAKAKQAVGI